MPVVAQPDTTTQSDADREQAILATLTLLLMSSQTPEMIGPSVIAILAPLGITAVAATSALALLHPHVPPPATGIPPRTAQGHMNRTNVPRSAAYLLNAAKRLTEGGSLQAERRYLSQHLDAQRMRREAATRVDAAAHIYGSVLGWRAVLDSHTTPLCAKAHGSNFHASTPPAGHYPGTYHGGACRCQPTAPWPNAGSVEDALRSVVAES